MSSTLQFTQQQILEAQQKVFNAVREAEKRILPAKLADPTQDGPNGYAIAGYLTQHGLDVTSADSYEAAFKALYRTLVWIVPPAKLVAEEQNNAPAKLKSAQQSDREFNAKVKAGEARDTKAAADKASIEQAKQIIENYRPTKVTVSGRSSFDWADIGAAQKSWTEALNNAVAKKSNLQNFAKWLADDVARRYANQERSRERIR
jgi:hypothetical protein